MVDWDRWDKTQPLGRISTPAEMHAARWEYVLKERSSDSACVDVSCVPRVATRVRVQHFKQGVEIVHRQFDVVDHEGTIRADPLSQCFDNGANRRQGVLSLR